MAGLSEGIYIITGGAIKLTEKMQDRPHTMVELEKIEKVRRFLIAEGIVDNEGFIDYIRSCLNFIEKYFYVNV